MKIIKRLTACAASAGLFIGSITCASAQATYVSVGFKHEYSNLYQAEVYDGTISFRPIYPTTSEDYKFNVPKSKCNGMHIKQGWIDLRNYNNGGNTSLIRGRNYTGKAKYFDEDREYRTGLHYRDSYKIAGNKNRWKYIKFDYGWEFFNTSEYVPNYK